MNVERVVIVGGGIAGVSTAGALREFGYDGEVVLVDPGDFPYDRPPLSKEYLAGTRPRAELALEPDGWYAAQRVELRAGVAVRAVRPGEDDVVVELVDERVTADAVVLATGGRPAPPPALPGVEPSRVHVLRTHTDADRLRTALVPDARLLVVGGGLIGAEVSATARRLGCEVTLVDPLDPPLERVVGAQVARWLHAQHAAHGIETVTGTATDLGDLTRFDAVLACVGMVPETTLATAAGIEVDGGILVDEHQLTSHPRVLAVGDASRVHGRFRAEHWDAAVRDGRRAAATLVGAEPSPPSAPWFWTDRYGRHVEVVGDPAAPGTVVVRGEPGSEPFAVFTVQEGRVRGAVAVDDSTAVRAARRMIDRDLEVDPAQLADPAVRLRQLLR